MNLDASNVLDYAIRHDLVDASAATQVEPLTGGVSCSAFRLWPENSAPIVIKQALPQLRVAKEWKSDPARAHREALLLQVLHEVLGDKHVPKLLFENRDDAIVAMTSAPADAENWKVQMLNGHLDGGIAEQVGRLLARMQQITAKDLPEDLWDKSFFYQLRVDAYILHVAEQHPEFAMELRRLAGELMDAADGLTHADYTPKNILVSGGDAILLDYEVGHIGHPVFDPASIVNHLYLKSVARPTYRAGFLGLIEQFLDGYMNANNSDLPRDFWPMLGALMLARVLGKSPVEYLKDEDKLRVVETGGRLLRGPSGLEELK